MNGFVSHPAELPSGRKVVALGVFDGVHRGHQEILRRLRALAKEREAAAVALFFEPHPKAVVSPPAPPGLTSIEMRIRLLRALGIDEVVVMPFTPELSRLRPEEFLESGFCVEGIDVRGYCVGENWRFGQGNAGTPELLAEWCVRRGAKAVVVPSVLYKGTAISSTRIRQAVVDGSLDDAREMLGRRYGIGGIVRHGWRNGHEKTSYPTANLEEDAGLPPRRGVYAVRARAEGAPWLDAIAYVGDAPTIRKEVRRQLTEVHFFEAPKEELYGRFLEVEFWSRVRGERLFGSAEELSAQIAADIACARGILTAGDGK